MISAKVAFVLRLVDDFSGKAVTKKKFLFYRDGRQVKPIEKEEGLYVFLEPASSREQIHITGSDYHPHTVEVEKESLKKRDRILDVRLYGKPGGHFPYRYSLLEGKMDEKMDGKMNGKIDGKKPVFPVEVCAKRGRSTGLSFQEIREGDGGQFLIVHGFTKEQLMGKTFSLSSKKDTEVFVIAEKTGMNEYRIEGKLTGKYPDKTPIDRVYRSVTDETGRYAIPVEVGEQEEIAEVVVSANY